MTCTRNRIVGLALGAVCTAAVLTPFSCTAIKHAQVAYAADDAHALRTEILESLASGRQPAWAGRYKWSNGRESRRVDISSVGFFYEYRHCTGVGELAYGSVERAVDGRLLLTAKLYTDKREVRAASQGRRQVFHFAPEMYSVQWGLEQFLVPRDLMPEFCSMSQAESWNSMRYATYPRKMIGSDESTVRPPAPTFTGLPDVPPEFTRYLPG